MLTTPDAVNKKSVVVCIVLVCDLALGWICFPLMEIS